MVFGAPKRFFVFCFCFFIGCAGSLLLHRLFSSCDEQGLLSSCGVHGPLIVVASLVEHRLWSV